MNADRHTAILVLLGILLAALVAMCTPRANAHDVYKGWVQSNGFSSCCNGDDPETGTPGDCRPARAYQDPDDRLWRVLIRGQWQVVPPAAVRPYPTPDGNSHVCESELNGIMCFVGGLPKS